LVQGVKRTHLGMVARLASEPDATDIWFDAARAGDQR
jgi:hypothetical protein